MSRNTPTGVGKTLKAIVDDEPERKHPHGRGEDQYNPTLWIIYIETPPRAWGRLYDT